ncbi:hypothetical protein EHS25_003756 [Saitozyma podzolica]|uniref:Uncharacterized protein n=1 Tax=Saitozyma podzolica TaxID=1890683 RepID=A0A427Y3F1_9TREE|nr:hypothetical protein EHS25_003756 [Saitozyma podzolica]
MPSLSLYRVQPPILTFLQIATLGWTGWTFERIHLITPNAFRPQSSPFSYLKEWLKPSYQWSHRYQASQPASLGCWVQSSAEPGWVDIRYWRVARGTYKRE